MRKLLGWDRYNTHQVVEALNDLYRSELRLWLNLFQPSVKLQRQVRVGSKLCRRDGPPQTPLDRVLAAPRADARRTAELQALLKSLGSFELACTIDRKLERIFPLADHPLSPKPSNPYSHLVPFQMARCIHSKATFLNGLIGSRKLQRGRSMPYFD